MPSPRSNRVPPRRLVCGRHVHGQRRRHAYGHGELQRKDFDGNDGEGNWQYHWQTLSSYRNSWRAVVVKFSEGTTSPAANFKFK